MRRQFGTPFLFCNLLTIYCFKMKFFLSTVALVLVVASALGRPSVNEGKRLIRVSETEEPKWLTEDEVFGLIQQKLHFVDITDHQKLSRNSFRQAEFPDALQYQSVVQAIFPNLSNQRMESFITDFSVFHTRYYTSATGVESSKWLLDQVNDVIAANANYPGGPVTARAFTHSWPQTSVIARIEGSDPTLKDQVVVLGAHADSVNLFGSGMRSPGADDDASGSVVLFESFRAILETGTVLKRSVEFQFYAAEEVGLRGSQDIAEEYAANGVNVISQAQFDVVGYFDGRKEIGIVEDYTNAELSQFLRTVVEGYLSYTWTNLECGYGCSDHASWTAEGFPAAFPVEIVFHPDMHTARDTVDTVNFEQVNQFARLAIGYAVELAEPQQ